MKHTLKLIVFTVIILSSCKKDDTRQVIFKWDKPCRVTDLNAGNVRNSNCSSSGLTLNKSKGQTVHYDLYCNCNGVSQENHLTITVKDGRKEKTVYESTQVQHTVNFTVD